MKSRFAFAALAVLYSSALTAQQSNPLVRLARIEVDSARVEDYHHFLDEEIEHSIRLEPGVITLYAVADKTQPGRVTLFETYADSIQYRAHLETPHFQKYKQGTLSMVKNLQLIEARTLFYHRKNALDNARADDLFIRLIKLEVDAAELNSFEQLATDVMDKGIKNETGLLVMYAVAETKFPARIHLLEVYANRAAYDAHLGMPHFIQYKQASQRMIKSLVLHDARVIRLGSRPRRMER